MEILAIACILSVLTIIFCYEYYEQLQKVRKQYETAQEIVKDIVISFNRQLKHVADGLEAVTRKVDTVTSKGYVEKRVVEELNKKVDALQGKTEFLLNEKEEATKKVESISKQLQESLLAQSDLAARISAMEETIRRLTPFPDAKIEAAIPIKKEKALAPLTETEMSVLNLLIAEGAKTAPEIKERISLSREHTSRLMKTLYEEGYLERDTSKIPFKYNVKEEMRKLLKRAESEPTEQKT